MAMTMMQINNLDASEKYLKKGLELLEDHDASWAQELPGFDVVKNKVNCQVNLALIYQKKQKIDQAIAMVAAALKLAPGNQKILHLQSRLKSSSPL